MAYKIWAANEISFALLDELTGGGVVTIAGTTPDGIMTIMGEPHEAERSLIVEGVHVSSFGLSSNSVGFRNLRLIADVVMKAMDYDDIRLEGEIRTTGANPGHRPRPIRFVRDRHGSA